MRIHPIAAVTLAVADPTLAGEPTKAKVGGQPATVTDWKADPACRLVFFAVL